MPHFASQPRTSGLRASLGAPLGHALLAGLVTAGGSALLPNRYRSEARILADTGHAGGSSALRAGVWAPSAPPEPTGSREDGATVIYADILRSRRLADQLLLGRYEYPCRSWRFGPETWRRGTLLAYLGATSPDRGAAQLRTMMAVRRDLKSGLLTISVESRTPALSREVVRRATEGLREILVELSQAAAVNKARFTLARLQEVKARYDELGLAFQRFQDGNQTWETSPAPNIRFRGRQLREELELWKQVVTNLTLNHEQALLEAQNDTQTLLLLDPGNLPVEKSNPARLLMVLAAACATGVGSWVYRNRGLVLDQLFVKESAR